MTLLLPWFPIVLAVGVGARLLGRGRGLGLGTLCALFWIVLVQAALGVGIWRNGWTVAALIAGGFAIVVMGGWAADQSRIDGQTAPDDAREAEIAAAAPPTQLVLQRLGAFVDQFDSWLERHRDRANPWPEFGEYIRGGLYQVCGATHIRPYRLSGDGDELIALHEPDLFVEPERIAVGQGIPGQVITRGRSYVGMECSTGEGSRREDKAARPIAWCFPVTHAARLVGCVAVGKLELPAHQHHHLLLAVEKLVSQFWGMLAETALSRSAAQHDPVSGLLTRPAFLRVAQQALRESYNQAEPAAVAVIGIEGLRDLNDSGRWDTADEFIVEAARSLTRKVRTDDRLGWFDGSRFVLLLRRVDGDLAGLIMGQVMSQLIALCGDEARWRAAINVRCGVAVSGSEKPDLRTLTARALNLARKARLEDLRIAIDTPVTATATA